MGGLDEDLNKRGKEVDLKVRPSNEPNKSKRCRAEEGTRNIGERRASRIAVLRLSRSTRTRSGDRGRRASPRVT